MIGTYTLTMLCEKYGVDTNKVVNKNNNILEYGEYNKIDYTLNYLINELGINPKNIEKCPSILYRNVEQIKENISFIKFENISFSNIETCLHVFSTDSNELQNTYNYVLKNYGILAIEKVTSILSVHVNIILAVESLDIKFVNRIGNLSVAVGVEWGSTNIEEIQKIIQSPEFKEHPELFTSETLAHAKLEEIQKIIQSPEFKEHPELFTSQTLAHAKLEEIQILLKMDIWKEPKYTNLLTSSIVAKSKQMITKIPILLEIANFYQIEGYINTSFLLFSPSQNYALIKYLEENNLPLVENNKLNRIFGKQPGFLKKKYNIDLKNLMMIYPFDEQVLSERKTRKI